MQIVDTSNSSTVKCLRNEISILRQLPPHKNVINFVHVSLLSKTLTVLQVKEFINYIILAIDYAPGGTLSDLIK